MSALRPVARNASGRQVQSQALVASQHTPRLLQQGVAGEVLQIIPAAVNPGFENGAAHFQPGSEPSKQRPALRSQRPLEVNVATALGHGPQEGSCQPNHLACDLPVLGELLKSAGSLLLQILHRRIRSAGYCCPHMLRPICLDLSPQSSHAPSGGEVVASLQRQPPRRLAASQALSSQPASRRAATFPHKVAWAGNPPGTAARRRYAGGSGRSGTRR